MFFVSIILWKNESAHVIWKNVTDPIPMALIAYSVCNAVRRITNDKVQAAEAEKYMDIWSNLAKCTLHQLSDNMSTRLLLMELPYWKNASCLEVAFHSENKDFIIQKACQDLLDTIWSYDNSCDLVTHLFLATIFSLFCPCIESTYFNNPEATFILNQISYAAFLTLFAYVLLFDLPTTVSTLEYVLLSWVLTMLAEEIQQMTSGFKTYFKNAWNFLDVGAVVVFFIGFGMRFKQFPSTFDAPRVVLAVDFVAFFFRLIQAFSVHKVLGPKIKMIKTMVREMLMFMMILAVFFASYAIASHSVLYPNSPITLGTVRDVLRRPYWHLYGLLFLEETEGLNECAENATQTVGAIPRCPSETGQIVVPIMMGIYMLFVNILLLNMLIAMFSHSISEIQINTEKHWAYERYFLIKEYVFRNAYVPPMNVIWMIYTLIQCCRQKRNEFKNKKRSPFREKGIRKRWVRLSQLEAVNKLLELQKEKLAAGIDNKIMVTHDTLRQMSEKMNVFKTEMLQEFKEMRNQYEQLNKKLMENIGQ